MCELDDFGVHDTLNAADTIACRCERPVMTEEQTAQSFAWYMFPTPDFDNAAELQEAYVRGWMARARR